MIRGGPETRVWRDDPEDCDHPMQWSTIAKAHPIREHPQLPGDEEGYPPTAEEAGPPMTDAYDLGDGLAGVDDDLEPEIMPGSDGIVDRSWQIPVAGTTLPKGVDIGVGGGGNKLVDGGTLGDLWPAKLGLTIETEVDGWKAWSVTGRRR